jgi:putative phage-type endonuclease
MSLTEEQLAERRTGIGGSDAAAALGLSPYKSALELFIEKREPREVSAVERDQFHWGTILEPVIRQEYANRTRRVVHLPTGTLHHPKHPYVIAHIDGITDDGRVFEAKTARSADGWGKSGTDEVPHHYLIQVQHYLAVVRAPVADIAVLIGGNDFRIYEVPADKELQEMILDGEAEFWALWQRGEPPPPDFDRADVHDLMRRLYPGTDGRTVVASDEDVHCYKVYADASKLAKQHQQLADLAKAKLLYALGSASRMTFAEEGLQLQRKSIQRKEHTIPASSYIDARFAKLKEIA